MFYLGGCAVVVYGWTVVGLLLEAYGFWLLFCEFFPTVLQFLRRVPVLSKILDLPILKLVSVLGRGIRPAQDRSLGRALAATWDASVLFTPKGVTMQHLRNDTALHQDVACVTI